MLTQQGVQDALDLGSMAAPLNYDPLRRSSKESVRLTMTLVWERDYKNGEKGYFSELLERFSKP